MCSAISFASGPFLSQHYRVGSSWEFVSFGGRFKIIRHLLPLSVPAHSLALLTRSLPGYGFHSGLSIAYILQYIFLVTTLVTTRHFFQFGHADAFGGNV
jgi:hypothetical protein